ncbi:MAG: leucine-rich repeat protein [Clostridia bacterium]|nr:leucine-rich repeat protein [Clostridia bacterium]
MRLIPVMLLTVLLACALLTASAETEGPVNPERMTVLNHSQIQASDSERALSLFSRMGLLASGEEGEALDFSVYRTGTVGYASGASWRVEVNQTGNWYYEFFFGEASSSFGAAWVIHKQSQSTGTTYTCCPAVVPGNYRLLVNLYDADVSLKTPRKQKTYYYTVAEDENHPPLSDYVTQIVAECSRGTDFGTALALYDWLTHHAYYDHSLSYYGADGVLVRGYGTCDSYSKAYCLLLTEAGIPAARISGDNHAWNRMILDGAWYQCDATWDDNSPTDCFVPVSGYEGHEFFGLTDELMLDSNHHYTPASDTACESLDMNYFVRLGGWEAWDNGFLGEMRAALTEGRQAFRTGCGNVTTSVVVRHMTIICWALNLDPGSLGPDWEDETLTFTYIRADRCITVARTQDRIISGDWLYKQIGGGVTVCGYLGDDQALAIPVAIDSWLVTGIGERAFLLDTRLRSLSLPRTVTEIGAEALWGCDALNTLTIPDTVTLIGEHALPEGWVCACGTQTALAHALGGAGYDFAAPDYPLWRLRWSDEHLAAAAYLGTEALLTLADGLDGVLALGEEAAVQVLLLPDGALWLDPDMPVPQNLWLVIAGSVPDALNAWADTTGVCVLDRSRRSYLPEGLTQIEAEAWAGTAVYWPVLPASLTAVDSRAFADCPSLAAVTMPADLAGLPDGVFGDADPVILAPAGSPAAQWAVGAGYRVLME